MLSSNNLNFFDQATLNGVQSDNGGPDVDNGYEFLFLNVQSLSQHKADALVVDYAKYDVKFICLCETWCCDDKIVSTVFPGFQLMSFFGRVKLRGGGVAIWSREGLAVRPLSLLNFCKDKSFEVCGLKWQNGAGKQFYIFTCYYSMNGETEVFFVKMEELLHRFRSSDHGIILLGDFNENSMSKRERERFRHLLASYGLSPMVSEPTRVTAYSSTVIDQIFVNFDTSSAETTVLDNTISDHRTVLFNSGFEGDTLRVSPNFYKRSYSVSKIDAFLNALADETWCGVYSATSTDDKFNIFYSLFLSCFEYYFPLKICSKVRCLRPRWVSEEVRCSSEKLKTLYCLQKSFPEFRGLYLQQKCVHRQLIIGSKRAYYANKIYSSSNVNKTLWDVVSELTSNKPRVIKNLAVKFNGDLVDDPSTISERFNDFLLEVPHKLVNTVRGLTTSSDSMFDVPVNNSTMFLFPTDWHEIHNIITARLRLSCSPGPDEVPVFLIKRAASFLAAPLAHIINSSFSEGVFPSALKLSHVSLMHKKGDVTEPNNYRPISLGSVFSKIFEYAMHERLVVFLDKCDLITSSQHGFRRGLSTTSALLSFYKNLVENLEAGRCPAALFCDLSRAFDCVSHDLLLNKMFNMGVRGSSREWFSSYLNNRQQCVKLYHVQDNYRRRFTSTPKQVDMGVPQGSILGPLLFLVYCNDLPQFLKSDCVETFMYADDTTILFSRGGRAELQHQVNETVTKLHDWFVNNLLYVNPVKTNLMVFHVRQQLNPPAVSAVINGETIRPSGSTKFLGITFGETLAFGEHCGNLVKILNSRSYQMRTLKYILDKRYLINIYCAQIQSRLLYGILIWGNSSHAADVFIAQKRVIRAISGITSRVSCREFFKSLRILTLPSLFMLELLCCVHVRCGDLRRNCDVHDYNTRNRSQLHLPTRRLEISLSTYDSLGLRLYNLLPDSFKTITVKKTFRDTLRELFLQHCFYSVEEFLGFHF